MARPYSSGVLNPKGSMDGLSGVCEGQIKCTFIHLYSLYFCIKLLYFC